MKQFTVIYLPFGREDKEWVKVEAGSKEELKTNFKAGIILKIEE